MSVYNFKKDLKLYVVRNDLRYILDIYPDISFSQTLSETSVPVKTLHSQRDMFENAVITKANPANFSFTIPLMVESDMDVVLNLLMDYDATTPDATIGSADLYVEMNSETYKLEKAVIESGTFQIVRNQLITLNVSGTAKKLCKYTSSIPGTLQARSGTHTYSAPTALEIKLGSTIKTNVSSISLEIKNEVQWVDFTTLQNSLAITNASGMMYPEAFVVTSRTLSGNVQQYVTNSTDGTPIDWEIGQSLGIRVGNLNADWVLEILIPSIVYTKRIDLQELLMQSYDYRMNYSPNSLTDVIKRFSTVHNLGFYTGIWAAI
jgi:hypothetical protein